MDKIDDKQQPTGILTWDEHPEPVREFWHQQLAVANLPPLDIDVSQINPDDTDFEMQELIAKIGNDPLLAAKVLAVANSSTMGKPNKITNTGRAIIQLGMVLVQAIILSYNMESLLPKHPSFKTEHFEYIRRWSTLSSHISYRLANTMGNLDSATICTAALLSRLSSLVLATIKPAPEEKYWTMPNEVARLLYEQERWGMSCPILSAHLVRLWGAPEPLPTMIETSWEPLFAGFEPKNDKEDEAKIILATGNALAAAYLSTPNSKARDILARVTYEPLKAAIRSLDLVEIVIDIYSNRRMQRELKSKVE